MGGSADVAVCCILDLLGHEEPSKDVAPVTPLAARAVYTVDIELLAHR
jgi:hypothetical protein